MQRLKKPNFEENEPNYFEDEEVEEKNDPFIDFMKEGGKSSKAPMEKDKESMEFAPKITQPNPNPIRKKSMGEEKETKPME